MSMIDRLEAMTSQKMREYKQRTEQLEAAAAVVAAANKGIKDESTLRKEVTDIMICGRRAHGSFGG